MTPVSTAKKHAIENAPRRTSPGVFKESSFGETVKKAKAAALLQPTAQYTRFRDLCQNNDAVAARIAETVIQRHELLEQAKAGQPINWERFDQLTEALSNQGIFLFKQAQLAETFSPGPASKVTKTLSETIVSPRSPIIPVKEANRTNGKNDPGIFTPSEENLLIMNTKYKNHILNQSLAGYGDEDQIFLPLAEMTATLDFSINVADEKGSARGWFISEDRDFSLDLSTMTATVEGRTQKIPPDQVMEKDGILYVESRLLSQWFPVDFKHNFPEQSLGVHPREPLPFQARLEREKSWKAMEGHGPNQAQFPREPSGYNLLETPVVDLGLSTSYTKGNTNENGLETDYYLLSRGDLGKMTTEIYLSGDDSDLLETSRFSVERNDPDAKLLGPLKATRIAAGDIRIPEFPILGGGNERGITVSNQDLNRSVQFDTTHFEGNLSPGWDVEVYRNRVLVDSQRVGASGRYDFEEIPIYYGKNDFELIFYGPQGQKRVETKQINIGSQMIKKGKERYQFSLSQKDSNLYDPDDFKTRDQETFKLVSSYEYGLSENLSLGGALSSQEINEKRHNYIDLGFKGNLNRAFITGDWVHDLEGGDAVEALVQTSAGPFDLRVKQQFFNNFTDEDDTAYTDAMKSVTDLSASGRIKGGNILPDIPFSITFKDIEHDFSSERILGARFAGIINQTHLNTYLQWREDTREYSDTSEIDGYFQANRSLGKLQIRSRMEYEIDPDIKLKNAQVSNLLNINDNLTAELYLKTDMENDTDLDTALSFNWDNGKYTISPRVSYNTDDNFKAMLSFSTSLGMTPRSKRMYMSSRDLSDTGSASARVFHDKNNNQIFDPDDEPIEGASVKALQSYRTAETNDQGIAFLTALPKYRPTDVIVEKESLEDPFWEPSDTNISIVPRPGHSTLMEIPVISTGEIDGTIYTTTQEGKEKPLTNVPVQLLDRSGKIIQQVKSEYDGFYLFMKIPPGDYVVQIDPENTRDLNKTASPPIPVTIDGDGNIASGQDLFLKSPPLQTVQRHEQAPDKAVQPIEPQAVQRYGLHISSYRSMEKAAEGINYIKTKFPSMMKESNFTIRRVDLGPKKGIWFRVIAGANSLEKAKALDQVIKTETPYCKIMKIEKSNDIGMHLASFTTNEKAARGLRILQQRFSHLLGNRDFSIRRVDLGSPKGVWFRVMAGKFSTETQAQTLKKQIRKQGQYANMIPFSF